MEKKLVNAELNKAIEKCGGSVYALAKKCGLNESTIRSCMNRGRMSARLAKTIADSVKGIKAAKLLDL